MKYFTEVYTQISLDISKAY